MLSHPDTKLEELRLTRELETRRAARMARLGPLPDRPRRERRSVGTPAVWFRRAVDQLRTWRTPHPRLHG